MAHEAGQVQLRECGFAFSRNCPFYWIIICIDTTTTFVFEYLIELRPKLCRLVSIMSTPSDRDYLLTLESVREQAQHVYNAAVNGHLNNFIYDATKLDSAADYVVSLILVCRLQ